ncbi:MAG: hypothetical protein AB1486_14235 [Planctomycetota bacterium]
MVAHPWFLLRVVLHRAGGIEITFREEEEPILLWWGYADKVHVRALDGSGEFTLLTHPSALQSGPLPPGRYEITVDPIEGYAPVVPARVEVASGEWVEHVIALRRTR